MPAQQNARRDTRLDPPGLADPASIVARLERLPLSPWHIRARVVIGVATFFDAFDNLAISFALPVLAILWKTPPQQIGLVLSSGYAGQLVGALAAGWLAERYGRLRVTTITIAIFGVMSLLCAFAWSPKSLMTFRFIQGIGLGGEVPVAASYISEIAQAKKRGRFFALYESVFALGLLFAALLGYWMVPRLGWQSMFLIGAAPVVLVVFLQRMLPESPRWLVSKGRLGEAAVAVDRIENEVIASGCSLAPPAPPEKPVSLQPQRTRYAEIFEGIYLRRTLVVWALWYCCFTVTYGLNTWLPTLYRTVFHLPLSQALRYGLITQGCGFVSSLSCAFYIDRLGRRLWFTIAFFFGGASLASLWFFKAVGPGAVLLCSTVSFCFISTISLLLNLYTPELYPTRMRAFGASVGSGWQRVAAAVGPNIVGVMLAPRGIQSVFVVFGSAAMLGGVVTLLGATETKGRALEQISP